MQAELIARARAVKGFMPDDEGLALYQAGLRGARTGLGSLLEVGTYCGKSAIYLGAAAREGGAMLVTVDHHRGSAENQPGWEHHDPSVVDTRTRRMDTLPFARRAIEEAGLESHVVLVVGTSASVAAIWAAPLAFLFIDGGHGQDAAWADYRAWTPKVAAGGYLAIHDVFPDPADGGRPPYELYRAALGSGDWLEEECLGCGSLRVLRRPEQSAAARQIGVAQGQAKSDQAQ